MSTFLVHKNQLPFFFLCAKYGPKVNTILLVEKVSFQEEKLVTLTVTVEVFTFHVHLAFERHTGTEGRELYFRVVFIL